MVVKNMVKNFKALMKEVKKHPKKTIAIACADDEEVLKAVEFLDRENMLQAILIGNKGKIEDMLSKLNIKAQNLEIVNCDESKEAANLAVRLVAESKADLVMKGLISTSDFLKAVLNKEFGLKQGNLLSHVAVFEVEGYDRLLLITDAAMNIAPDFQEKVEIIKNSLKVAKALKIEKPRVAVLAAVEKVNTKMQATLDAAGISKMAERGQIKGALVDGPLALDNAVSQWAAEHKGIKSHVAGKADILVVPNIETGNVLYKSLAFFAKARSAGIVAGAKAPVVVTSRADSWETKINSIALGLLIAKEGGIKR